MKGRIMHTLMVLVVAITIFAGEIIKRDKYTTDEVITEEPIEETVVLPTAKDFGYRGVVEEPGKAVVTQVTYRCEEIEKDQPLVCYGQKDICYLIDGKLQNCIPRGERDANRVKEN